MKRLRYLLIFLIVLPLLFGAGCLQGELPVADGQARETRHEAMRAILDNVTGTTQDSLDRLDGIASGAAIALQATGISGPEADSVLNGAVASHPAILTMITCDGNGTVLAAEPESAKDLIGQDLSGQDTVKRALFTREPLMSDLFFLAQGGTGISIAYPVHSSEGEFLGVVSMVFLPGELITPIVEDAVNGTPYSFQVIEVGALILYDPDPDEVGKETFNETLYAEFLEIARVARHSAANRSGYDTYSFYRTGFGKVVNKETFWSTAGLHGTEWRVMVIGEL
jgi:hypothetical protein